MTIMTKPELALLEKVWAAEVASAFNNAPHVYQTKSKLAQKLEADGLIRMATVTLGGRFAVTVKGYELTDAGRLIYCASCD